MAARRVVILEPSGRMGGDLVVAARRAGLDAVCAAEPNAIALAPGDLILVAPAIADSLDGISTNVLGAPTRWVFGDVSAAPRLAGAAVACGAVGVLLAPFGGEALAAAAADDSGSTEADLARARSLVAATLVDVSEDTRSALAAIATAFAADDCIVWWRDGDSMLPQGARMGPDEGYRGSVAAAARIAAAGGGTVITPQRRSIIAAPLRPAPSEVAGLVAVISDHPRRFSPMERADLRALSQRLARELSHLAGYRRILAEGERLRAGSLHDPLTGAMTRGAFDQAVTNEVAAAVRRGEPLCLVMIDVVGMRRINLAYGHHAGDDVLAQVAARVRAAVRGNDPVGRFSGDDLAVLLIGVRVHQATSVAGKLVARVGATPITTNGHALPVQVRVVLTPIGAGERSGEAAYARAGSGLRSTPPGKISVVAADLRPGDTDVVETAGVTVGTTLGGTYRVLHELSRGAMGVVYRADDLGLGRPVAIKVLRSDLASDRELVTRFRAEAAMLASLHHKNLVQVFSLGEHGGDVYFVMELVEGQPLTEVLKAARDRDEWLPTEAIQQIVLEIADALDAMHGVGLIHRDVKPANILLDRERDRAVLVDIGVATRRGDRMAALSAGGAAVRMVDAGGASRGREELASRSASSASSAWAAGTPGFSAPESFLAADESPASDVYGLAATVYCMLTGQPPHGAGQLAQVLSRQLHEPLLPPSRIRPELSDAIDAVIAKALDPQPLRRWSSAGAFAVAISAAIERLHEAADGGRLERDAMRDYELEPDTADRTIERQAAVAAMPADEVTAVMAPTAVLSEPISLPRLARTGRLRGAHFRVAARVIAHRLGGAALRDLGEASPGLAMVLASGLSPLAWEPIQLLIELLDRCTGGPPEELARVIGRGTVTATFTRFFGANPASLPVVTVLRAAPAFWGRYHDWSKLTVVIAEPGHVELSLDARPMSPLVVILVAAELGRVAELAGAQDVIVTPSRSDTLYHIGWRVGGAAS